jgi:D-glycero-alpha-D-manno-heptose-7-phosphate kinase
MQIDAGVEIHHDADLPARTGLGSSSAFTVGLLNALHTLKRKRPTKMELAREAIHVEQEVLGECVGCQDQVIVAHGGLCRIDFRVDDLPIVTHVALPEGRLAEFQRHLLLCFTGLTRFASTHARTQVDGIRDRKCDLSAMHQMVTEGAAILAGNASLRQFGRLLDEAWRLKRSLTATISTPAIDGIYTAALDAGAIGGKLLGAGGGGFMLLFAEPEAHARIRQRLQDLLVLPFALDVTGSQIVLDHPEHPPA